MENIITLVSFISLMTAICLTPSAWQRLRQKTWPDWCLDVSGLCLQGLLIPLLQMTVVYSLYHWLLPSYRAHWHLSPILSCALSLVVVDYLYYWNHRLLHHPWLWPGHLVHHTVSDMDVLGTSRNTFWTSFLILYLWIHPLFIYLLDRPSGYSLGIGLTAALDLWRHSPCHPPIWLDSLLRPWLMLPLDHALHHGSQEFDYNYGANFKWWDLWHGTYRSPPNSPTSLGIPTNLTLLQKLFAPRS